MKPFLVIALFALAALSACTKSTEQQGRGRPFATWPSVNYGPPAQFTTNVSRLPGLKADTSSIIYGQSK